MNEAPTIFITYNPRVAIEETLAVRLQTIGAVNGFDALLPDRFSGKKFVSEETARRIKTSDYFVLFLTGQISEMVKEEIDIAFKHLGDPSRIIVIYDQENSNNLAELEQSHEATLVPFNPDNEQADAIVKKVMDEITKAEEATEQEKPLGNDRVKKGLFAFLAIGLGLLILALLFDRD